MKISRKTASKGIRREGSLQSGPILSNDDPALAGMTSEEKRAERRRHAENYGSLSGLEDFFAKCSALSRELQKRRGELAIEHANELEREARRLEIELKNAPPALRAQIYRAIAACFTYANLKRELERGSERNGGTFSMDDYQAAAKKTRKKDDLARLLGVSRRGLSSWESKNLA